MLNNNKETKLYQFSPFLKLAVTIEKLKMFLFIKDRRTLYISIKENLLLSKQSTISILMK